MSVTMERFTDRARKVMALANSEAQRLNHEYIGTEHILLGLVKDTDGFAIRLLRNLDIDPRKVRLEVEKLIKSGDCVVMGKLPYTPQANHLIELAVNEAKELSHNYVGTEHLLLGMLRMSPGNPAFDVLTSLTLKYEEVREEVLALLEPPRTDSREWEATFDTIKTIMQPMSAMHFLDCLERISGSLERIVAALEARK